MLLLFENPGGFMLFHVLKDDGKFTKADVITVSGSAFYFHVFVFDL
jgi:hypothetical protein